METMQIVLAVVLLVFIVVLLKVKQKGQSDAAGKKNASKPVQQKASSAKKNKDGAPNKKTAVAAFAAEQNTASKVEEVNAEVKEAEAELSSMGLNQPVKVSVQEVDPLTEYKVYREFGYLDKAAEALLNYLQSHSSSDSALYFDLAEIYLQTEQYEKLVDFVLDNKAMFDRTQIEHLVKSGLELDANNLDIRVLAEELLNWDVETINTQVLHDESKQKNSSSEKDLVSQATALESGHLSNLHAIETTHRTVSLNQSDRLVTGHGIVQNITQEELQVLSVMLPTDNAMKLMRGFADYATFSHKLNRVLPKLKNPASALIDALGLDYQNKNIDAFAKHLWELYSVLGKNGQNIKDKMLGWGYSLGHHELFNRLAMVTNEQEVKDIGKEFGYRAATKNLQNHFFPLVSDDEGIGLGKSLGRDVNSILQEADAYLMYGQLDEAMQTLEQGIKSHKSEPQLYINLFELYERAEDWERLEEFSKRLRTDAGNLPEEVILAMSQLTQKLKNNNIGMVA
ncbi:hypothetical protein LVJ82_11285 [Vitreoscilla massiliensis]|uniref:Uncharacterized protein n=2 Tax=Vitreoscilla massiliensis TaxID=1689272 RepID=A0ABY4DY81_9NEIS|nr:hypothetical protein [Vitreoscilla massiliensis]UOO88071.1 hypothetical protein LVJ82_11285 [Vitreoscilla massiliensis]